MKSETDRFTSIRAYRTMASPLTPRANSSNRKSSGKDKIESVVSCVSESGYVGEWVAQQVLSKFRSPDAEPLTFRSPVFSV